MLCGGMNRRQRRAGCAHNPGGFRSAGSKRGQMPHLATSARDRFAIEMQFDMRIRVGGSPVGFAMLPEIAKQIRHCRRAKLLCRAEWQATDGPQLLLKLAGDAGINRQMPGVMRTRRQFVDQQLSRARDKKLHAQHTHNIQCFENAARNLDGFASKSRWEGSWRKRDIQNMMAMRIFNNPI